MTPLHAAALGLNNLTSSPVYRAALARMGVEAAGKLDAETVAHLREREPDFEFDDLRDPAALLDDVAGSFIENDPWLDAATVRVVCASSIALEVARRR